MIDKKIEEAKDNIFNKHFLKNNEGMVCVDHISEPVYLDYQIKQAIELGAKWAIKEFLKDLWHSASEVPHIDNGRILAFSKEIGNSKLYDTEVMLDEIYYFSWQDIWEEEVKKYNWSNWLFVEDLLDLITKGGNHD